MEIKPKICVICESEFTPYRTTQKVCSNLCAIKDAKIKVAKKEKAKWKKEFMALSDWLALAQKTFNAYIRLRDANKPCISCGKPLREGNVDAGHFYSRKSHMNITFNEYNVNAQCSRPCNMDLSGDPLNYRVGLINRYGIEVVEELEKIAKITKRYTIEECEEIIKKYKKKIKELK